VGVDPGHGGRRGRGGERRVETIDRFSPCLSSQRPLGSYGWPVKPFDEPHPVRGNFGDPRTNFAGGLQGGGRALGGFRFHNGIDVAAPDGTPVYPVVSGRVVSVAADFVGVATSDRRHFQYWHIRPDVRLAQAVIADHTVLGHIIPAQGHVHLTEIDGYRVANPLLPGHIFPYRDVKPPRMDSIRFLDGEGRELGAGPFSGKIVVLAAAHDEPSLLPPPGQWRNVDVTPAVVRWWLSRRGGPPLRGPETAFDVRHTLPSNRTFWSVYAPGTFQNFPASDRRHLTIIGRYIFRITELDTDQLPDGPYTLTVEAADVCGNTGLLTETVEVDHQPEPSKTT
jgi:hypothetical protein